MSLYDIRTKTFKLKHVISIYENDRNESYFDIANVYKEKILAFKPITEGTLRKLLVKMLKMAGHRAIHHYEFSQRFTFPILYIGNSGKDIVFMEEMIGERDILFMSKLIKAKNLPTVIYVVTNASSLSVYERLPNNTYISLNLPNISSNGSMCLGGKTLSKSAEKNVNSLCQGIHDMFWKNSFTTHGDSTGCNWDKGVYEYKSRVDADPQTLNQLI